MNKPTVHYDPPGDVLYFLVRNGEEKRFAEVAEGVNVELDQEEQLLGVEILNASRLLRTAIGPERPAQLACAEARSHNHSEAKQITYRGRYTGGSSANAFVYPRMVLKGLRMLHDLCTTGFASFA